MGLKADMKILVVDDMATMRKIIKNMLGKILLRPMMGKMHFL